MSFRDAIKRSDRGVIIDLEVTPGSKTVCIPSGYNQWRKRIEVKLSQNAQKGRANDQLIENLSTLLDLGSANIIIAGGAKSTKKSVLVRGMDYEDVVSVMSSRLNG